MFVGGFVSEFIVLIGVESGDVVLGDVTGRGTAVSMDYN